MRVVFQILGICFAQNLRSDIQAQRAKWHYWLAAGRQQELSPLQSTTTVWFRPVSLNNTSEVFTTHQTYSHVVALPDRYWCFNHYVCWHFTSRDQSCMVAYIFVLPFYTLCGKKMDFFIFHSTWYSFRFIYFSYLKGLCLHCVWCLIVYFIWLWNVIIIILSTVTSTWPPK